jgi:hypothetical protein
MPKFTVAIPEELLRDAKAMAAKTGTSMSAIVRLLLEGFVKSEAPPLSGNYEILLKYSLGQLSAPRAAHMLHLETDTELNALALQAGFPLPRLALQETEAMQKRFGEMLDMAETNDDLLCTELRAEMERVKVFVRPDDGDWMKVLDTSGAPPCWIPTELINKLSAVELRRRGISEKS